MSALHESILTTMRESVPEGMSLDIPSNSIMDLGVRFLSYKPGRALVCTMNALERFANSMGRVQGGIIAAALDATFGSLAFLYVKRPCVTISMEIRYIHPLPADDREFVIEAILAAKTRGVIFMEGRVLDAEGSRIALASITMTPFREKERDREKE
ncbi:MAG TPA: PaaI family thioesterase [Candidatus Hydrogenedentes bacterium]|nr:PaaI family thioesterase [Candidatus Hydrogenedentota bacterium]